MMQLFVVDIIYKRGWAIGFIEEVILRGQWGVGFIDQSAGLNEIVELAIGAIEALEYFLLCLFAPFTAVHLIALLLLALLL